MHHLLTGRDPRVNRPFDFPPVRNLAPQTGEVVALTVDRALAVDPRARYGTAADMRRALHATSPTGTMPRTVSGALSKNNTGSLSAPVRNGGLTTQNAAPGAVTVSPQALRTKPAGLQVVLAGATMLTGLDDRTVRIRNRTRDRIQLTVDSDVSWLRTDPQAVVLEPRGKARVSIGVNPQNLPAGVHSGRLRVHGGGQTWTVPVRVRVRGTEVMIRRRLGRGLQRLAAACLTVGLVAFALSALGMPIIPGAASWDLVVFGLVSSVLLGVVGVGRRP
jgi:hypothetical protein